MTEARAQAVVLTGAWLMTWQTVAVVSLEWTTLPLPPNSK